MSWKKTIALKHNEVPAKVNLETGEIITLEGLKNVLPDGKSISTQHNFAKVNNYVLNRLIDSKLEDIEVKILAKMISLSSFGTNALLPFNDESTNLELAEAFKISRNRVNKSFKKLYDLGVFAHVNIARSDVSEFWILNPYISWKGKMIDDSIFVFFKNTDVYRIYLEDPSLPQNSRIRRNIAN
jgi:hypothetical protein